MQEDNRKNKIGDAQFQPPYKEKYENLKKLLYSVFNQLEKVQNVIDSMEQDERKYYYQSIPGIEGKFDGRYIVAEDGRKTEVPENYAAKSRLVYGDVLKVFADSGKQIFKQIDRVERKKIEGVLAKKEGKWYLLSDAGSYRVSDASADFNGAQLNDKASAYIPANIPNSPWAALDEVYGLNAKRKEVFVEKRNAKKFDDRTPLNKKEIKKEERREEKQVSFKPKLVRKVINLKNDVEKPVKPTENTKKEYVDNILEDEDLR